MAVSAPSFPRGAPRASRGHAETRRSRLDRMNPRDAWASSRQLRTTWEAHPAMTDSFGMIQLWLVPVTT